MNSISNIKNYVENILKIKNVISAYKYGRVYARPGIVGEEIITYKDDNSIETRNFVKLGDDGVADWVVEKISDEKIKDIWVVKNETFIKTYTLATDNIYEPIKNIKRFIQIDEDISFMSPWGELQYIDKNGYLCIDDLDNIYGIQEKDFLDTYKIIEE